MSEDALHPPLILSSSIDLLGEVHERILQKKENVHRLKFRRFLVMNAMLSHYVDLLDLEEEHHQ